MSSLFVKVLKTIDSCDSAKQLDALENYVKLAGPKLPTDQEDYVINHFWNKVNEIFKAPCIAT